MKRTWKKNRLIILESNRAYNTVAADKAGFPADNGRTLTPEEISSLNLTPPDQIRDCRVRASSIFWR